ncbi:MAG: cupredoxin domain-containing protein [Actinobacteria bacterium]|nr:cupredoxin domain-containing protein [Actinomycetota bacterium]
MKIRAIVPVAVMLVGLAGCGSDDATTLNPPPSTTTIPGNVDLSDVEWVDLTDKDAVQIQVRDNEFLPSHFIVEAGTPITFRNVGRNQHNALPVDENEPFEAIPTEDLAPKDQVEMVFSEPGEYPYPFYCSLHGTATKGMTGAVRVVEGSAEAT